MTEIIQKENPILRSISTEVPVALIKSRKIETIIRRMQKALAHEDDGIAIAAPQIGENLRIFVVSKKVFEMTDEGIKSKPAHKTTKSDNTNEEKFEPKDLIFINPQILKVSKEKELMEEGCLSVRWLYGQVKRARKILIKAYDENGKPFTFGGSGLMAQIFQHEIDHLEGVLFTDKARGLKEIPPPSKK